MIVHLTALLAVAAVSSGSLPPFRVLPQTVGRAQSARFVSWVRPQGSSQNWTAAPVLQTTARNDSMPGGCGYFGHLNGWSASWLSFELAVPLEVRVRRVDGTAIGSAAVHPASSGATVVVAGGEAVVAVPAESRFAVDFDGAMDETDTGPMYTGPPVHTFSVFANELDPNPPAATDPDVTAIAPGDPLPLAGSVPPNTTLLFLPGEHRPPKSADGWARYTMPSSVRVHIASGAILYASLNTGTWGAHNITLDGFGILSGEDMDRCANWTALSASCQAACPVNDSPGCIQLTGVTNGHVSGVTCVDFPNHHLMMQATDCSEGGHAGVTENVKVLGWRANGDGLHVFGSWRVRKLFMRTQDDSMYLSSGNPKPPCAATAYSQITTWNDANGASFCFTGNGSTLSDSDVIYSRASWEWWDGGRVFSGRGDWSIDGVTVTDVRLSDPLPSMDFLQLKSTGHVANCVFQNVTVAVKTNTASACPQWGHGCNCVPPCGPGPLPQGLPNLITGNVRNLSFDNVTLGGESIAASLFGPRFNVSNATVEGLFVDGRRVL
jgi:hypothetical protein